MTLQNEHILMEEAHRRVAQKLRDAELDRFGRRPRRAARAVAVMLLSVAVVFAAVGLWGLVF